MKNSNAATAVTNRRGSGVGTGDELLLHTPLGTEFDRRSRRMRVRSGLAAAVAIALTCAACSSDSKGPSAAAATTPPTTAAPAAAAPAPTTTAAPTTTEAPAPKSPEVDLLTEVLPTIDALIDATGKGDLKASEAAAAAYDSLWNGVEVYTNIRSVSMYLKLEADLQGGIEDGLGSDAPDFAALNAMAKELKARFQDNIAMSAAGVPLNPLVDDVTTLRIIRRGLREASAALADGDVAAAKAAYAKFKEGFDSTAEAMLGERDADNEKETETAVDAAAAGFDNAATSVDDLSKLVAKATSTYNFGVSLWNAAARNADDTKTDVTNADLIHLGQLHDVRIQLIKSMNAWTAGNYDRAGSVAAVAGTTAWVRVQPSLAAKNGSDAALKKLIDTYTALAGAAGDPKEVGDANLAAVRGVEVAMHVLLGQFWTTDKVQSYLDSLPAIDPLAT